MGYRIATFYRITIDTFHIATITNDTSAIKSNYQTIFDLPTVFSPDAAPSTGGFERICPLKPEERRIQAAWGVVSFGYFSLDKQRKVPRLSGRDPTSKNPVAIATQCLMTLERPSLHSHAGAWER